MTQKSLSFRVVTIADYLLLKSRRLSRLGVTAADDRHSGSTSSTERTSFDRIQGKAGKWTERRIRKRERRIRSGLRTRTTGNRIRARCVEAQGLGPQL